MVLVLSSDSDIYDVKAEMKCPMVSAQDERCRIFMVEEIHNGKQF